MTSFESSPQPSGTPQTAEGNNRPSSKLPMSGVRVVDVASIYAGPLIATLLADFGANVLKVEHPRGDGLRGWAWNREGVSLWWSFVGRNKRAITLNLSDSRGAELLKSILKDTDVFIENFRPGTLEKWGLGPDVLLAENPRLVIVRVSGFGQTGPYSPRPGFGTLAEAISGFAYTNGAEDGPPVLPQWPLADGVAALAGAFATMVALRHAEQHGEGQVVDLSIYEPLFWILGAQTTAYDQLGTTPGRHGSSTEFNIPRGCYRTLDDKWVALSGATTATGKRILTTMGRADVADAPWFATIEGRAANRQQIDGAISEWVSHRQLSEVLATCEATGATVGPVYSNADIVQDPHFLARKSIIAVEDAKLGPVLMQGLIARLTKTPGEVRTTGPDLGQNTLEVLSGQLGLSADDIAELVRLGVCAPVDSDERTAN